LTPSQQNDSSNSKPKSQTFASPLLPSL
jgi:hypothetical protein